MLDPNCSSLFWTSNLGLESLSGWCWAQAVPAHRHSDPARYAVGLQDKDIALEAAHRKVGRVTT